MPTLGVFQFVGGQTDNWLGARADQWKQANNLMISQDNKLESALGGVLTNTTDPRVAPFLSSYRIGAMIPFADTIFKQVATSLQYLNGTTQTNLQGPAAVNAFSTITSLETIVTSSYWNNHQFATHDEQATLQSPVKWYQNSGFKLRSAGLKIPTGTFAPAGGTYRYAFVWKYTYDVNGVEFVDRGTPKYHNTPSADVGTIDLTTFVMTNGTGEHYDVASAAMILEVYQTVANGSVFYKVSDDSAAFQNPTLSATAAIATPVTTLPELYTTGGIANNDRPPKSKYLHMTTSYGYYAAGVEVSVTGSDLEFLANRLWQSKANDPDSVPAQFYVDLEDDIIGISSVRSIPVVFCKNGSIYRIDGYFDDFGRQGMIAQKINEVVGGIGQLSIVQTLEGVFFAGIDNWYFTDCFKVEPVSDTLRTTYATLVDTDLKKKRMYGAYDGINKLVYWACRKNEVEGATGENNAVACFDIQNRAFSFWDSGYDGEAVEATLSIGTTNATAVVTAASTSGVAVGQYVFASNLPLNTFVVSFIANTSITLSNNATSTATVSAQFIDDTLGVTIAGNYYHRRAQFFKQLLVPSLCFLNDSMYVADVNGYVINRLYSLTTLPKIDPNTLVANWQTNPILFDYISAANDFGRPDLKKWVSQMTIHLRLVNGRPPAPFTDPFISIQPKSENNGSGIVLDMKPLSGEFPSNVINVTSGETAVSRFLVQKRRFPATSMRCFYKQLHLESLWASLLFNNGGNYDADISVGVNIVVGTGIATITAHTELSAFTNIFVDQALVFPSTVDEETEFKIITKTSNSVVVVADPNGLLANGSDDIMAYGYVRGAIISLVGYLYDYTLFDNTAQPYQGASVALGGE